MQSHENMDAMAALVCGCLNVRVSFVSGQLRPVSFFQLALAGEEALEAFFKQKLIDVTLDLTGVTKEHAFLTRRKAVGEWFITSCLNCGMAAYAEHVKHSLHKVLVSSHLVRDARTVEEMVRSPQYSPAFRVLLKPKTTDLSPDLGMPFARQDASLERQHELQLINGKSTKFLRQKQLEMEKRIREFADQQKLEFSELQRRTIQDKNVVLG
ncbi:PREDICTED: uncharacterized protein LOC106821619 [Priapulus caudatus]|uniref:Uncharacterized protein LOC106821619 n=1 Tax=Priapulus caudatus TaxID=37621 RepID=A0ABM1FC25_PRICU|nr:PREDICTED: uncharacterized protein LOC106821619 [Priapulus caudatus]